MAFIRIRGAKALLLHSVREGKRITQKRLYAFDRHHPCTPEIRRALEERYPHTSLDWERLLPKIPPAWRSEGVKEGVVGEDLTVEDEPTTLKGLLEREGGFWAALEVLVKAAPSPVEAAVVQALLDYHTRRDPFDLIRTILDALGREHLCVARSPLAPR